MSRNFLGKNVRLEYPLLAVVLIELAASVFDLYQLNYVGGAILIFVIALYFFGYEIKTLEDLGYPKGAILGPRNGPARIVIEEVPYKKTTDNFYGRAVYVEEDLVQCPNCHQLIFEGETCNVCK